MTLRQCSGTDRDEEVASDECGMEVDLGCSSVHFSYGLLTDNATSVSTARGGSPKNLSDVEERRAVV